LENLQEIWREYRPDNVGPGSVVVDLGCSEGYFTDWAKSRGATVDSYDARYGLAVGPVEGWCSLRGEGVCAYVVPGEGDIPMTTLQNILSKHERVDFLKCDIEGGEYLIFDCDLSKVEAFGIEFHAWTTADDPKEGLAIQDYPMPANAFNELLTRLSRTHTVEVVGDPLAGGYLIGRRQT
jgi:hypothetical protein